MDIRLTPPAIPGVHELIRTTRAVVRRTPLLFPVIPEGILCLEVSIRRRNVDISRTHEGIRLKRKSNFETRTPSGVAGIAN